MPICFDGKISSWYIAQFTDMGYHPPMLNQSQLDAIDHAIETHLMAAGIDHVIYMDMGGNTIAKHDNGKTHLDSTAFAALAAGKAFAQSLGWRYVERRGLIVVERAQTYIVHSAFPQRDEV